MAIIRKRKLSQIEVRIAQLEKMTLCSVPGTIIQRVLPDVGFRQSRGLPLDDNPVWCVALGSVLQPKMFGYGATIMEALDRLEEMILDE